eukprot:CAMPEP_0178931040 /NCGR_PEP_ID=MMETSP0786-20121207/21661_1 /TAXON_ID=186022 /ORGANISM="Thalassionema frauenfeldii, Strain CCMP 1798" /LENGTH=1067 /DNA_ID=CAMNT_0020607817 /DNA_START=69 /DNA_END=3272 /DNA_ORIENTATION=-
METPPRGPNGESEPRRPGDETNENEHGEQAVGVRDQSPSRARTRSRSPAPRNQSIRDQSPSGRSRIRSRSPSAMSGVRSRSPSARSGVRSRSPSGGDNQDSLSSVRDDSLRGLDLEESTRPDDLSLSYSIDEPKTRASRSAASASDDLSLSYSVDEEKSRASTYISAVSDEGSKTSLSETSSMVSSRGPPPTLNFRTETIPEDEPVAEGTDQASMFGSFLASPLEYVFGGNDDDVSTLGEFNDYNSWDGDNSTIATTTTLKRELQMQHQPTIFEGDEEEEDGEEDEEQFRKSEEHGDDYTKDYEEDEEEEDRKETGSYYGAVSEASQSQEDGNQYQKEFTETSKSADMHEKSLSGHSAPSVRKESYNHQVDESEYTYVNDDMSIMEQTYAGDISAITEDPYFRQRAREAKRVEKMETLEDVEEEEEYDEPNAAQVMEYEADDMEYEPEDRHYDEHQSAKSLYSDASSVYSDASPNFLSEKSRFNVTDEDAARNRSYKKYDDDKSYKKYDDDKSYKKYDDDNSISLSTAMESESVGDFVKGDPNNSGSASSKQPSHWSASENTNSSRSEAWQRDMSSNRTWRSAKMQNSQRSGARNTGSSFRRPFLSSRSVGSYRTTGSVMPGTPEVIREGDNGHPTMTRGMSGRAVIHVKMDHARDGTIEELSYTTPLVDCNQSDSATHISYGDGDDSVTRPEVPFFDYYFARYRVVRMFMGRRCYRIMALVALVGSIAIAVLISLVAQVNELDHTPPSSTALAAPVSLDDLTAPTAFSSVNFRGGVKSHLHDWFVKSGDYGRRSSDIPFYVDIPMSGPEIVSQSWGECLGLTLARDQGRELDSHLRIESIQGAEYVVVDLSTKSGIKHAAKLNLVPSGFADVIISPLFHDVVDVLYSSTHKAKFLITMRNPIQRTLALYNHMKTNDAVVSQMSIEQFAQSNKIENNYVTRILSGKRGGELEQKDVNYCKELLRRKAVVGTYEEIELTLRHFEQYLGWLPSNSNALNCQANIVSNDINNEGSMVMDESSGAYVLLKNQNRHDLALYSYVKNVLVPYQHEVIKRQKQAQAGNAYTVKH